MAIAYRASAYAHAAAAALTISKPTGTVDGDVMVAMVMAFRTSDLVKPAAPAGWTEVCNSATAPNHWVVFTKRASSEGTSYEFTSTAASEMAGVILTYSGVTAGTIVDVYSNTKYGTNDTSLIAAGVTTNRDGNMVVFLGSANDADATGATVPSGFTERVDAYDATTTILVYAAELLKASAGATGDATATLAGSAATKHAFLVTLFVAAPPTGLAISEPSASEFFVPGETIDLTASATDPEGEDIVYRWWYNVGAGDVLIGTTDPATGSGVGDTYEWDSSAVPGGAHTLTCRAINESGDSSAAATVAVTITAVVISAPTDLSSHVAGAVSLTGKGYLVGTGDLRLQWEIDTANPPSNANDDYDFIVSAVVAEDTSVSVTAAPSHLGTWYIRARTIDAADAVSPWTIVHTFYVLEELKLDAGSEVEISIAGVYNKVFCYVEKSSPVVVESATNSTTAPTYATSPRELFVTIPAGADSTAAAAVAAAQLALRKGEQTTISGLRVKLEDGMKIQRGDQVGVNIERMDIDLTLPVREMTFDVASDICEITLGDFWEPRTDQDALVAIAQKLQQLKKAQAI